MKKIIVTIVTMIALILGAAPANAYDNSSDESAGYVTYVEWQTEGRGTMTEVERSWGVVGEGTIVSWQNNGKNIVKSYPYAKNWRCTGSTAQVTYSKNTAGQYMSNYMTLIIWSPDPLSKVQC